MIIDRITNSTDTNIIWRIKYVTWTESVRSVLKATNLNKGSSNSADAVIRGDGAVTGLTDDGDILLVRIGANSHDDERFSEALRLGQNDAVAVECETNAAVEIVIIFHFDSEWLMSAWKMA